jgi:Ras-related protein Rab-2A
VWLDDIRAHADPHLTCVLIANKVDLCENEDANPGNVIGSSRRRQVSTQEAELWAKEEGLLFLEASAKTGYNVDEVSMWFVPGLQ